LTQSNLVLEKMNLVIAYYQWEVTVMWVEAKMRCDEVTDNMMKHNQFFNLLVYYSTLQHYRHANLSDNSHTYLLFRYDVQ